MVDLKSIMKSKEIHNMYLTKLNRKFNNYSWITRELAETNPLPPFHDSYSIKQI